MIESKYISSVFDVSCRTADSSWEAAAWSSEENQKFLFDWCLSSINCLKNDTILDVGCGHGDLINLVNPTTYTGIDISGEMIKKAQSKHPEGRFIKSDIDEFNEPHDWVIAIGPFNLDVTYLSGLPENIKEDIQINYLETAINNMYRLSKRGLVSTILSDSLSSEKHIGLFYYNTIKIINICLKINKRFIIDHMSSPNQLLIYIPK